MTEALLDSVRVALTPDPLTVKLVALAAIVAFCWWAVTRD